MSWRIGPSLAMPDSWPNNPVERTAHSAGTVPMRGSVPVGHLAPHWVVNRAWAARPREEYYAALT
jgi:hypothetical protein